MSHFARVQNGVVVQVLVAEQGCIDTLSDKEDWIQTSYNTYGGVHANGGTPLRKNYAGVGFSYDKTKDAFISPQPFASWALNDDTCLWNAPIARPTDGKPYSWDEASASWVEM